MARLLLSLVALLLVSGCATTSAVTAVQVAKIALPIVDEVIRRPAPRPLLQPGEPSRIRAARALIWGGENANRLLDARRTYEQLRQRVGGR